MKLLVINKYLKNNFQNKDLKLYFVKRNDDFIGLKALIEKDKPDEIISIDFGIPTTDEISNGSIIIAKDTICINDKPVNWTIPREDRWNETSENLNKSICDTLEKLTIEHYIGSGIELKNSSNIEKRIKAKEWIKENIKGIYIDNYSSRLNEFLLENNNNCSIIRIISSSFPINHNNNNFLGEIKRYFRELYFYKITAKKIQKDIIEKKLISEIFNI